SRAGGPPRWRGASGQASAAMWPAWGAPELRAAPRRHARGQRRSRPRRRPALAGPARAQQRGLGGREDCRGVGQPVRGAAGRGHGHVVFRPGEVAQVLETAPAAHSFLTVRHRVGGALARPAVPGRRGGAPGALRGCQGEAPGHRRLAPAGPGCRRHPRGGGRPGGGAGEVRLVRSADLLLPGPGEGRRAPRRAGRQPHHRPRPRRPRRGRGSGRLGHGLGAPSDGPHAGGEGHLEARGL
ncbi:unnamed protein product, partial [Prorocentrum cordatum]